MMVTLFVAIIMTMTSNQDDNSGYGSKRNNYSNRSVGVKENIVSA